MAEGQGQFPAGQYLGTASAPVSRVQSAEAQVETSRASQNDSSPPSSESTAVNGNTPAVRFGNVQVEDRVHDISLPAPQTENELRRALGSASAPASPGDSSHPPLSALKKSETLPESNITQQPKLFATDHAYHPDPAVAAGLLPSSAAEPQTHTNNFGSRSAPNSRRTSRPHSPSNTGRYSPHTARWPHAFNFPGYQAQGSYYGRGSHQAQHSKPLYSLARPLPTREQRDMQKAYRESIKAHVGPGSRRSVTPNRSHNASQVSLVGPGAHHPPYYPYGPPLPLERPHSHHHRDPGLPETSYGGAENNDQIMRMLRQILNQQQGKPSSEGSSKDVDIEVRDDDDPDAALARKEGFGESKENKARIKEKTHRAERSDSISSSESEYNDVDAEFPNPWARFRHALREPFAEFLGTMLLIMFGTGVSLQYFLSLDPNVVSSPRGTYLSVSFGWGIGVGVGVWVAGGISGGHINPAVTLSLAVFRGFPWKKVPGYVLAQIIGSMTGAGLNYAIYRGAINIFEGGSNLRTISGDTATASLFSTYPLEYVTDATAFFQEFLNTAILLITVLAISDSNNAAPPDGLNPLVLLFLVVGIGACFGMQTAYCINPARDIGPRLITWFTGYGRDVWNFRSQYWLWVPWCATLSGGLMGCFIYDMLIYTGSESPINAKWDWPWRKKGREGFAPASKQKMPLGQSEA